MTVSIKVFQNGELLEEEIYAGRIINDVLTYFSEKGVQYHVDKECDEAYDISKNKDIKIICIDNTNLFGVESTANIITEYMVEYDEKLYNDLKEILN